MTWAPTTTRCSSVADRLLAVPGHRAVLGGAAATGVLQAGLLVCRQQRRRTGCSSASAAWIATWSRPLKLFEQLLNNPRPDAAALKNQVAGILKQRQDAKLNKGVILNQAMLNYAEVWPAQPVHEYRARRRS
ncbi:MAG: hypothetical protein WKG07_42435 [Hymenobacter sp.]